MYKIFSSKKMLFSLLFFVCNYAYAVAEVPADTTSAQQTPASFNQQLNHQAHVHQFNSLAPLIQHLAAQPHASANMTHAHHTLAGGTHYLSIIEILHILSELIDGINALVQPDSAMHNAIVVPALNNIQELSNKLRALSTKHASTDLTAVYKTLDEYIVAVHKLIKHID